MAFDKYQNLCEEVDLATAALETANKNAERLMLGVLNDYETQDINLP